MHIKLTFWKGRYYYLELRTAIGMENVLQYLEEFEDTKVLIRIRKWKKDRQHNSQKKKDKRTNNDIFESTCQRISLIGLVFIVIYSYFYILFYKTDSNYQHVWSVHSVLVQQNTSE
jgi:hypothetical protein